MEELNRVLGVPSQVIVAGKSILVHEVKMKDLSGFYTTCAPFFKEFADGGKLSLKQGTLGNVIEDFTLFEVICLHSDSFMDACEMTTNASVEFMRDLRPDQFFELAREVVQVNGSFFVRALAPSLANLAKGLSQLGQGLSHVSSLADTITEISETTDSAPSTPL